MRELIVVLGYAALALVQTGITSDIGSRFFSGPDPVQDVWILNWVARHLLRDPLRIFEGNCFYPTRDAILLSDPLLGPAALVAPLGLLGANPVLLYNSAVLLTLTLASYGFYRLAWRLSGDRAAALFAGIVIPHTAQQLHHLPHLNLLSSAGFPFLLLALLGLVERPGLRPALAAALAFAWQAGSCGYHAFSCAFLALIVGAWHWRRFREPRFAAFALLAALLAAMLLAPYVLGFLRLRGEADSFRSLAITQHYSLDLATGLFRSNSYLWRGVLRFGGDPVFPGLLVLVFAALGISRGERRNLGLLGAIFGVFLLLALGPDLKVFGQPIAPLPFKLLFEHVPLFDAVRHPVTFAFPATMALGLLAVLGLAASGLSKRPALLALVLAGAIAETLVPPAGRTDRGRVLPEVYEVLRGLPAGAILEVPIDDSRSQWWAVHHGMPIVNGLAAFEPRRYSEIHQRIGREWRRSPAREMEDWGSLRQLKTQFPIRYVVLRGQAEAYRLNLEASPGSFELLHQTRDGDRIYRLRRSGSGRRIERWFRDDQLAGGRLVATLRGPAGALLSADLNDTAIEPVRLSGDVQRVTWTLPQQHLVRGLNQVVIEVEVEGGSFDLLEVDAEPGESVSRRSPEG